MTAVDVELIGIERPELPRAGWGMPLARGAYHRPAGARPRTAFIAAHYNLDFADHYLGDLLARRGFGFLGWNTRFCGAEHLFTLDRALIDIGLGVEWLRVQGAETVVLLGNSGGGSLMAAYVAQSRRSAVRPARGLRLARGVDALPAADLYVSVAAHPGRPEVLTAWLDPAVLDEGDPTVVDSSLDMYDAANGPPYPPEFVSAYRAAQRARNERITAWCRDELERVSRAGLRDRLFVVARTWADLRFVDPALDPSERPTPACYRGDPARANRGADGLAMVNSLRTWLAMWSLEEAQCRTAEYLPLIDLPALVVQPTADSGVFPSDARAIHEGLGSTDKRLVEMAGDHYFRTPDGTRDAVADLIAGWVAARGGAAP